MSKNQLQKLDMPADAHNIVNTSRNWTKVPQKEVKFQGFSKNMINVEFKMLKNCAPWLRVKVKHCCERDKSY